LKTLNYYSILGVRHDADDVVIAAAYRALAKKYHPDTSSSTGGKSTKQFRLVQEAYDVLGDRDKRKSYDQKLASDLYNKRKTTDRGDDDKQSSKNKEKEPEPPKSEVKAASQKGARTSSNLKKEAVSAIAVCVVGAIFVWTIYQARHVSIDSFLSQTSPQTESPKVDNSSIVAEVATLDHGRDIYGRAYPSVNSAEKGNSGSNDVGLAVRDIYGRDPPYINSSGKEDLSLQANKESSTLKCKLYLERIVGENIIENSKPALDVFCLEKLRYDESARSGTITPEQELQKKDN
jgi:curved DNA-binding protein CbpA